MVSLFLILLVIHTLMFVPQLSRDDPYSAPPALLVLPSESRLSLIFLTVTAPVPEPCQKLKESCLVISLARTVTEDERVGQVYSEGELVEEIDSQQYKEMERERERDQNYVFIVESPRGTLLLLLLRLLTGVKTVWKSLATQRPANCLVLLVKRRIG